MTDTLTIRRPDDWHLHLRDGEVLKAVLARDGPALRPRHHHAESRAPRGHGRDAAEYRDRILAAKPSGRRSSAR
jgi:dihydroorotase